jgi:hypothetical protein
LKDGDSPGVKITLKFKSPSPRPETPETRKLNIKPIVKKEDEELVTSSEDRVKRETSPGLAKISALVCGPPKPKPANPPRTVPPGKFMLNSAPLTFNMISFIYLLLFQSLTNAKFKLTLLIEVDLATLHFRDSFVHFWFFLVDVCAMLPLLRMF